MALDARGDGLYARVAWNEAGEANRREGYYVYPSPAWLYSQQQQAATGKIVPDELRSIGLINSPRIPDSAPWTNSAPALARGLKHNADPAPSGAACKWDLSTKESRAGAFAERMGQLTAPVDKGGMRMISLEAHRATCGDPDDRQLLTAMGHPVPGGASLLR